MYFLEDDELKVFESRQKNSGLNQGKHACIEVKYVKELINKKNIVKYRSIKCNKKYYEDLYKMYYH